VWSKFDEGWKRKGGVEVGEKWRRSGGGVDGRPVDRDVDRSTDDQNVRERERRKRGKGRESVLGAALV
jgi:hypothetical protein